MSFIWSLYTTIIVIAIGCLLYFYTNWKRYFTSRGIKCFHYSIPLIGNNYDALTQKEHTAHIIDRVYKMFPDENYVGHMQFISPLIVLKNLDTIKKVTVKDFDHFLDHVGGIDEKQDPLFGGNLFALKGEKWKDMRATLSPAFTSSKMRNMFQFVEEIARQTAEFYLDEMKLSENKERGFLEIEMKEAFTRYANDVIATSAFGIKINSFQEKENEFYIKGSIATNFSGKVILRFLFISIFPRIAKFLGIKLFSDDIANFFRQLVLNTMKNREINNIVRNDMIQLLMEAKKGSLKHDSNNIIDQDAGFATVTESSIGKQTIKREWTENDIIAQAILFFVAGFDTSSTLLSFMAHEITINPSIQRKLQYEIDELVSEKGSKLDYNDLTKLKYMDMVVSETLRFWPPAIGTDRKCRKKYTLPPTNNTTENRHILNPGDAIWIPIYSIHRDSKYYENPQVFDPERFSDENKHKIHPLTFIPFGVGPRNCIGSRFALMETKAILFHLLAKFDFIEIAKTDNPLQLLLSTFNFRSKNGIWIGLKPRDT